MGTRPPERPCTSCGQMCRSVNRVCLACSTGHTSRYVDGEPVALTGGSWQPVRGVQRWVPDPEVQPGVRSVPPIACHCGARADQSCQSRNGSRVSPHKDRRIPRQCPCSAPVEPGHRLCDDCKLEANRRSTAKWTERRRNAA